MSFNGSESAKHFDDVAQQGEDQGAQGQEVFFTNNRSGAPEEGDRLGHETLGDSHPDVPLPRPRRQRRRAKEDRGLPPDKELARLATEYLQQQRKLWPGMVKMGQLPEPAEDVITAMVEDFKSRHRGDRVSTETVRPYVAHCPKLGGGYSRYSCDNSDPKSIIDQLVNELDKAKAEGRFIPWSYVFADYSVSGLDSSRQGYNAYKRLLNDRQHPLDTTYIDDFIAS